MVTINTTKKKKKDQRKTFSCSLNETCFLMRNVIVKEEWRGSAKQCHKARDFCLVDNLEPAGKKIPPFGIWYIVRKTTALSMPKHTVKGLIR